MSQINTGNEVGERNPSRRPRWVVWALAGLGATAAGFASVSWLHLRQANQDIAQAHQDMARGAYSAARKDLAAALAQWPSSTATTDLKRVNQLQQQVEASDAAFTRGQAAWDQGQWTVASAELSRVSSQNSHHAEAAHELALLAQARQEGHDVSAVEGAYSQLSGSIAAFLSDYNAATNDSNKVWTMAQSSGYTYSFTSASGNPGFVAAVSAANTAQAELSGDALALSQNVTVLSERLGVLQSQPALDNSSLATLLNAASAVANNAQAISVDMLNEVDGFMSMASGTYTGGVPTDIAAVNSSLPLLQSSENTVVQAEAAVVGYETGVLGKLVGTSSNLTAFITPPQG